MVAPTAGVSGFVRRGEEISAKPPGYNGGQRFQRTDDPTGSLGLRAENASVNVIRQTLAASARVKLPQTKLELSQSKVAVNPLSVTFGSSKHNADVHVIAPTPRSSWATRQTHSQWPTTVTDGFDTDVDGIDDTTTASLEATTNNTRSVPSTQSQNHPTVKHEEGLAMEDEEGYEEEEEGTDSDGSVEVDPMQSVQVMGAFPKHFPVGPGEEEAFLRFQEELRITGLSEPLEDLGDLASPFKRKMPATKTTTRPSSASQPFSRARLDTLTDPNDRVLLQSADSSARTQKQPVLGPVAGPVSPRPDHNEDVVRQSKPPVENSRSPRNETARSVYQETRSPEAHPALTLAPSGDKGLVSRGLPLHPMKVQGAFYESNNQRSDSILGDLHGEPHAGERSDFMREHSTTNHKRQLELDHTEAELARMSYDTLRSESFDHNPKLPPNVLPDELKSQPLRTQLEHMCNLRDLSEEDQFSKQQDFFATLSLDRYDECGDLILEKFGEILGKFKKARQDKRKSAMEFEDELSRREHAVSLGAEAIEKDLTRLRKAGEDVINGNGP